MVDDDIDSCAMEEARNLNLCRTDGGGASELQHKISVNAEAGRNYSNYLISIKINYMNSNSYMFQFISVFCII